MGKMIEAVNVSYIYQTKYQKTKALSAADVVYGMSDGALLVVRE